MSNREYWTSELANIRLCIYIHVLNFYIIFSRSHTREGRETCVYGGRLMCCTLFIRVVLEQQREREAAATAREHARDREKLKARAREGERH